MTYVILREMIGDMLFDTTFPEEEQILNEYVCFPPDASSD